MTASTEAPRSPTEVQWNVKNLSEDSVRAMKWWREFNERNAAKQIITLQQYERAHRQAESIRRIPEIAEALGSGIAEVSAFWTDALTGEACRCRPDFVQPVTCTSWSVGVSVT